VFMPAEWRTVKVRSSPARIAIREAEAFAPKKRENIVCDRERWRIDKLPIIKILIRNKM